MADDGAEFGTEQACRQHECTDALAQHVKRNCASSFDEDANRSIIEHDDVTTYIIDNIDEIINLVKG